MDSTALSLCMEHELPIMVFDVRASESVYVRSTASASGRR